MKIIILHPFNSTTFQSSTILQKYLFFENPPVLPGLTCDLLIVYEDIPETFVNLACKFVIYYTGEPPDSKPYTKKFLSQFDLTCSSTLHSGIPCANVQQSLPWHVPLVDDSVFDRPLAKDKCMSVVSSTKTMMPGHLIRHSFVERLMRSKISSKIDFYGYGYNPIENKKDALFSYRFSVCIENSSRKNYWTEKISDSILMLCVPIYYGCININEYFEEDSYIQIDITKIEDSIRKLQEILECSEVEYQRRLPALKRMKKKIVDDYHLIPNSINLSSHINFETKELRQFYIRPWASFWGNVASMYCLRIRRGIFKLLYKFGII